MDGVFMRKGIRNVMICLIIVCSLWIGMLAADRKLLNEELIRLHVVANSDSVEDQAVKIQVKDAVVEYLLVALADISDVEEAKCWIAENVALIQNVANSALFGKANSGYAEVSFRKETFNRRYYDTFALPAGVYDSLRITLGEGKGKNWWCVAFPTLCAPVTTEGFETVAAGAGFSERLSSTLEQEQGYKLRFYLLDLLGEMENIFFSE